MKLNPIFGITCLTVALTTSAQAKDNVFGRLLGAVIKPGQLTEPTSGPSLAMRPNIMGTPSAAQSAQIDALTKRTQPDPRVTKDLQETSSLIARMVTVGACGIDDRAWNSLNRSMVNPGSRGDSRNAVAHGYSQYHDARFCYDVLRLTNFSKPAANALQFRAEYVSPQTEEATHQDFTLVKTPEGEWLVKYIGGTNGILI